MDYVDIQRKFPIDHNWRKNPGSASADILPPEKASVAHSLDEEEISQEF